MKCRISDFVGPSCSLCRHRLPETGREVAAAVSAYMRDAGVSNQELADRIGISNQSVSRWVTAKVKVTPHPSVLLKLMEIITERETPGTPSDCPLTAKLASNGSVAENPGFPECK